MSRYIVKNLWLMLRGGWFRLGYAVANFGAPVSIKDYMAVHNVDFSRLDKDERIAEVKKLAEALMDRLAGVIPAAPVSLVAGTFLASPNKALSLLDVKALVQRRIEELKSKGALVYLPRQDGDYTVEVGLRMLLLRRLVREENGLYFGVEEQIPLLEYYANSIAHFFEDTGHRIRQST